MHEVNVISALCLSNTACRDYIVVILLLLIPISWHSVISLECGPCHASEAVLCPGLIDLITPA